MPNPTDDELRPRAQRLKEADQRNPDTEWGPLRNIISQKLSPRRHMIAELECGHHIRSSNPFHARCWHCRRTSTTKGTP